MTKRINRNKLYSELTTDLDTVFAKFFKGIGVESIDVEKMSEKQFEEFYKDYQDGAEILNEKIGLLLNNYHNRVGIGVSGFKFELAKIDAGEENSSSN